MSDQLEIAEDKSIQISWGAIAFLVAMIFAVGGWAVSQEIRTTSHGEEIVKIQTREDGFQEKLESIERHVIRIELMEEKRK